MKKNKNYLIVSQLAMLLSFAVISCNNNSNSNKHVFLANLVAEKNSDYKFIDSCFRWVEERPTGGSIRLRAKEYDLGGDDVLLPQVTGTSKSRRKFMIDLNGAIIRNGAFTDGNPDWNKMHDLNTFRSFTITNGEFNGQKNIALNIKGAQMNTFENLVFAGCRYGGKFELCLQTYARCIETNQCQDTGVYFGIGTCAGCEPHNSQTNNVTLETYRDFGAGTAYALVFDGVSGCRAVGLTNEGKGSKVFLTVNGKGSNWMKSFYATDIHIEAQNSISTIMAYPDGYANFNFGNIYAQYGNLLIDGYGTGIIRVDGICYQPYNITWKYSNLKFRHNGSESAPLWWEFSNCVRYGGKPMSDPFYWVVAPGSSIPKPFAPGQVSSNNGSARLKENILIKE